MHLLLLPSEAPLSSILKNWRLSLFSHEYLSKGLTNFGRWKLKLHTLNYHISGPKTCRPHAETINLCTMPLCFISIGVFYLNQHIEMRIQKELRNQRLCRSWDIEPYHGLTAETQMHGILLGRCHTSLTICSRMDVIPQLIQRWRCRLFPPQGRV